MADGSLMIDSVRLGIEAATAFDRAERIASRVSDAVKLGLPVALAETCQPELQGEGHIFIDRLEVASQVATHWNDDRIATRLAQQIGAALSRELNQASGLAFRDRSEFIGAYAMAIIEASEANRWWFAEFDGLSVLPVSVRLRTLIVNEREIGFQALALLSPAQRTKVFQALHEPDARRIIEQLSTEPCPFAAGAIVDAVGAPNGNSLPSATHEILEMLVQLTSVDARPATRQTVRRLELVRALFNAGLARQPISGEAAAVTVLRRWTELIGGDAQLAAGLQGVAERIVERASAQSAESESCFRRTPYGGAFLLLAVLGGVGWWEAWQRELASEMEGPAPSRLAAALSLAVVARALNPGFCRAIEMDEALRLVFFPGDGQRTILSKADKRRMAELLGRAGPTKSIAEPNPGLTKRLGACALALLDAFSERIPGCAGSTPAYIRRNLLTTHATVSMDGGRVRLGRPPLDVLLTLSGLKRATVTLPHGLTVHLCPDLGP